MYFESTYYQRMDVSALNQYADIDSIYPEQNSRHFADDIVRCISVNEKFMYRISLMFVPKDLTGNESVLVQVMTWCRTGGKLLPEPTLTQFGDAYMRHYGEMSKLTHYSILQQNSSTSRSKMK